jgi:hypothetical protein
MHSNEKLSLLKSEVLTMVLMNIEDKWNVTSCWLVNSQCHVGGVQCLHLQGQAVFDEVLFYPEDGGTTLLQKALNYLPVDEIQHTKHLSSSNVNLLPNQCCLCRNTTINHTIFCQLWISYPSVDLHTNFSTSHNYCKSKTCLCICFLYHRNEDCFSNSSNTTV